jgi:hypothetical protein
MRCEKGRHNGRWQTTFWLSQLVQLFSGLEKLVFPAKTSFPCLPYLNAHSHYHHVCGDGVKYVAMIEEMGHFLVSGEYEYNWCQEAYNLWTIDFQRQA